MKFIPTKTLLRTISYFFSLFGISLLEGSAPLLWIPYYGYDASFEHFRPFEWVVLQPDFSKWVRPLSDQRKTVFGYISLGSYYKHDPEITEGFFSSIDIAPTPDWPDAMMVDVRAPLWVSWILETKIPSILHLGFHGLFLDTVDNAQHLETSDPKKFAGMQKAMLHLIQAIRENYPEITIIMNRGLFLGESVAPFINAILLENLFSHYNFTTKEYELLPESDSQTNISAIETIHRANPLVKKLSLDFWNPDDATTRSELSRRAQSYGFSPYVGDIDLKAITPPSQE